MKKVNRAIKILLLFLFMVNVGSYLFQPLLAVFVVDFIPGATISVVGFATAFFAITKSSVQLPTAKFLDKNKGERDDFYALIIGASFGTLATFAYLIISQVWHLYAISMLAGVAAAFQMAAYYAIFSHHVDGDKQGFEWSLFSVGGLTLSSALGGALGGMLVEATSFKTTFFVAGIISFASTVLLLALYPLLDGFRPIIKDAKASIGVKS